MKALTEALQQVDSYNVAHETMVFYKVPETSNGISAKKTLTKRKVEKAPIKQNKGKGRANTDNKFRPGLLESVPSSVSDNA